MPPVIIDDLAVRRLAHTASEDLLEATSLAEILGAGSQVRTLVRN